MTKSAAKWCRIDFVVARLVKRKSGISDERISAKLQQVHVDSVDEALIEERNQGRTMPAATMIMIIITCAHTDLHAAHNDMD